MGKIVPEGLSTIKVALIPTITTIATINSTIFLFIQIGLVMSLKINASDSYTNKQT